MNKDKNTRQKLCYYYHPVLLFLFFTIVATIIMFIFTVQHSNAVEATTISDREDNNVGINVNSSNILSTLTLKHPVYIEHFKQVISGQQQQQQGKTPATSTTNNTQNATKGSFSGNGIVNGRVNVTANGIAKVVSLGNMTVFVQGNAKFVSQDSDKAPYIFQAIGHYNNDGGFSSSGAAIFNSTATGKLSFLRNVVGIYKDQVDRNGNGTFAMWEWK